jgi:glycosyltransferase involved in cell wall biosynthesis
MNYYIVIPAHNEEAFISLTLQSLISQTHLPSKVVVVNDNSTDKTAEIVLAFANDVYLFSRLQVQSIYLAVKLFSFSKALKL